MLGELTLAIAAGEALLLFMLLVAWIRDKNALGRFVRAAADIERLKSVATRLPGPFRPAATQFAGELAKKGSLDEILVAAITRAAQVGEGSLWSGVMVRVLAVFAALAPLVVALVATAGRIGRAIPSDDSRNPSRLFLEAREALGPVFIQLQESAQSSALLVAGLVLILALDWLLRRREAREAQFVQAVLRAAMAARPTASAPIAGRLSELLAPERSLRLPITAMGFFFASVGLGWTVLVATAGVREANAEDVYNVWPKGHQKAIKIPARMTAPKATGGGRPIKDGNFPTLSFGPDSIDIASNPLATLAGGRLADNWDANVEGLGNLDLETFKRGTSNQLEFAVLCDRPVVMATVVDVLSYLKKTHDLATANLVVERHIRLDGEPKVKVHAALPLRLAPDAPTSGRATLSARIGADRVTFEGGGAQGDIDLKKKGWQRALAKEVRARIAATDDAKSEPEITIKNLDRAMTCEQFVEILSAADSTCEKDLVDCGVPGLGLVFRYGL